MFFMLAFKFFNN